MNDATEVERKLDILEARLDRYQEWMEDSIQQRDRLCLDAAWGVHYALYAGLGSIGAVFIINHYLESGWLSGFLSVVVTMLVPSITHVWSNGARMKEVDRLARLPEWRKIEPW